jgi:hypothetical protein
MEVLRKSTKILQNIQCLGWDSSREPPEYELRVLPLWKPAWVLMSSINEHQHRWGMYSHKECISEFCVPTWTTLVGFEVFTAVVMESIIFWDVTPCSLLSFNRRFGGTYRLHLQGRRNNFSKTQQASTLLATCLPAGYCWNYFFDPEDGGDMFLRNVGCNSTDYTASHPRRWYFWTALVLSS